MASFVAVAKEVAQVYREKMQELVNPPCDAPLMCFPRTVHDAGRKQLAVVFGGAKTAVVAERPAPLITEPNDAIVRITSSTICGSDLHMYENSLPGARTMEYGDIMGHEGVGIIESIGENVTHFKVGDKVVISAPISCGTCKDCMDGRYSHCDATNPSSQMEKLYGHRISGIFGYSRLCGAYEGCQAEYVRVPIADVNLLKIPHTLPDEKVLVLSDIMCTGWHGNELAEVGKGKIVGIWGCGPVGLMAAYLAKYRGAAQVFVIDNCPQRLNLARVHCGAETINFNEQNVLEELHRLCPGGLDCSIDCAGYRFAKTTTHQVLRALKLETDTADIVNEIIVATRKGGNVALIGDYFAYTNGFLIGGMMEKGLTIRGGQVFVQKYWRHLLSLIEKGTLDPSWVFDVKAPLANADEMYKRFYKREFVKCILYTSFGADRANVGLEGTKASVSATSPTSSYGAEEHKEASIIDKFNPFTTKYGNAS